MSNSKQHVVQQGDTLEGIARKHGTSARELQQINPIIRNPDHIQVGWKINLPGTTSAANDSAPAPATAGAPRSGASAGSLPPPQHSDDCSSTQTQASSACTAPLVDVVHITGDPHFHVLTEEEAQSLKREIRRVQEVMDDLKTSLDQADQRAACKKEREPDASCTCARCKKEEWAKKAQDAGLLNIDPPTLQPTAALVTEKDIQGQLTELRNAREWYVSYNPVLSRDVGNAVEGNWRPLQQQKVAELDAEIVRLRGLLSSQAADSSTRANGATPNSAYGRAGSRSVSTQRGSQRRTGITVVEVSLFSQPDRRYYISSRFHEQVKWKEKVSTRVMQGKAFNRQLGKQLLDDIREGINDGRRASPLGSLEAKLVSWSSSEDNLLNALHKEIAWTSNSDDAARYAVSSEAHALRFAASASAGVNNWNPSAGNIEVGAKGSAAFSLGEGAVSLNTFFPSQGGRTMQLAYRNANGETVLHPFGVFRLHGKLEVSCFVGAQVQGSAQARAQHKPSNEGPSGATALLGSPRVETGRGGNIGVKGDAFAGAQAGGALSGAVQWIEPDKVGRGPIISGQSNASSSWTSLMEIKADGNAALGIGAGFDFGLSIEVNRLAFNCSGRLVFGPGASGGFATVVDLENTHKVVKLICDALAEVNYHYLLSVDPEAFMYIAHGLFQVASTPRAAAFNAFEMGRLEIARWWASRAASKSEAESLAAYLINHRAVIVNGQRLPLNRLPPETIGPMVYVLSESFVTSWNETQEHAIVLLLSHLRSWRHMIEVLEHCSPKGRKVSAMASLERINSILDGTQQRSFNRFIQSLAVNQPPATDAILAWQPVPPQSKREVLLAAQHSGRFSGLA